MWLEEINEYLLRRRRGLHGPTKPLQFGNLLNENTLDQRAAADVTTFKKLLRDHYRIERIAPPQRVSHSFDTIPCFSPILYTISGVLVKARRLTKQNEVFGSYVQEKIAAWSTVLVQKTEAHPYDLLNAFKERLAPKDKVRSLILEKRHESSRRDLAAARTLKHGWINGNRCISTQQHTTWQRSAAIVLVESSHSDLLKRPCLFYFSAKCTEGAS